MEHAVIEAEFCFYCGVDSIHKSLWYTDVHPWADPDNKSLMKNGRVFSFSHKNCLPVAGKCFYKGDGDNLNRELTLSWNIGQYLLQE